VSCAIDKYMYICVSPNFHKRWKISYSKTEYANSIDEIQHDIVKAVLKRFPFDTPLDIVSVSDLPAGSGVGSSSAYTVGLINALMAYSGHRLYDGELAQLACEIEIEALGKPIGKQDQYAVAYGGLNYIEFGKTVNVSPLAYPWKQVLADSLVLMFTGDTRQADSILSEVSVPARMDELRQMRDLANQLRDWLIMNYPPTFVATVINAGWELKKLIGPVSTPKIELFRQKGLDSGAIACKLLGAGQDGFILFYCTKDKQPGLKAAFPGMTFVNFNIDNDGSRILYR
jgi:D-glycero-alpha-D-manno-heptose-7-phosphate kinase